MKLEDLLISILCVISFFIALYFLISYEEVGWDSAQYLKIAEYWLTKNPAFKEFKWPEKEFKILALSPLLSFFEYLIFLVFGVNLTVVKILYAIFLPLLIFSIYKLLSLLKNKRIGLFSSLLVLFNSVILFWSTRLYTDVPAIAFLIIGLYLVVKNRKNDFKSYLIAGFVLGLSFLMRIPLILHGLLIVGLYLFLNKKLSFNILGLSTAFILFIPWLVYLQTENIGLLEAFGGYSTSFISEEKSPIKNFNTFLQNTSIFWLILLLIGILSIRQIKDLSFVGFFVSITIYLITPFGDIRYAIPAFVFGSTIIGSISSKRIIIIIVFFLLLFLTIIENISIFWFKERESIYCSKNSALIEIGKYLKENKENDTIVFSQNYWPEIEFYSKKDTYAMLKEEPWLDYLFKFNRTRFIVLENNNTKIKYIENFSFIKVFEDNCKKLYLYGVNQ